MDLRHARALGVLTIVTAAATTLRLTAAEKQDLVAFLRVL
jgi:hypothetical protein